MRKLIIASLTTSLSILAACGDEGAATSTDGGGETTSAQGGAGGDTSTGGASTGGSSSGGFNPSGSGGSGGGMSCLEEEAEATTSPLDIVVLLDRSSSMQGTLWNSTETALTNFFQSPGGADISASLSYFPPPTNAPECQPSSYDPPHVALSDLSTDASVLVNDLQSQSPTGDFTPTYGGLYGSLLYANALQDQNDDHVVIVVLASDGDPTSCNTDIPTIASLAKTAYDYNGVRTFVIAIQGATVSNLDQIAAAGQTTAALDVTNDITKFKQKMDEIRAQVLACEYIIPEPEDQEFDPTKVNVKYTPGEGEATNLPQVQSPEDCGNEAGWYYDNNSAPTKIIFCPASCETIQADANAKVNFVFGCPTVVK